MLKRVFLFLSLISISDFNNLLFGKSTVAYAATDLMQAAQEGNLRNIQRYLERGDDMEANDEYGRTALMYAIMPRSDNRHYELVKFLVDNGANFKYVAAGTTPTKLARLYSEIYRNRYCGFISQYLMQRGGE